MKVCIDPGHGGSDPGAVSSSGLRECDVALSVGLKVIDYLAQAGIEVVMTREADVDVAWPGASASEELQARCDVANEFGADIFVSIHCNAAENPAAHGTETYYHAGSARGSMLAQYIHCELVELGLANRGTKTANFYVLRNTAMPAVLIELAFISNHEEEALLASDEFQRQVAEAIARGIVRWLDA